MYFWKRRPNAKDIPIAYFAIFFGMQAITNYLLAISPSDQQQDHENLLTHLLFWGRKIG